MKQVVEEECVTGDKSLRIPFVARLDSMPLDEAGEWLQHHAVHHTIGIVNWPQVVDYRPDASFAIARGKERLYIHFMAAGEDLRAVNTEPLSPVAQDSCVEFFMQVPGDPEYWNFEFNCIGTVNASHRVTRPEAVRLTEQEIATIGRVGSCGTAPFAERPGFHRWTLTVSLPLRLVRLDADHLPPCIMANVYKCADKTAHPHLLSWAPIAVERPNFHEPAHFAPMFFE